MCGILFSASDASATARSAFAQALQRQAWRGPDATGIVGLCDDRVLIGHNRLAIIDLHRRSDQPMRLPGGRLVLTFNGEIYNHLALRERFLLDCASTSDTETLLVGLEKMGCAFVQHLEGMFAFVVYDTGRDTWFAARDGLGIKPLYYYREAGRTVLASEPVAIRQLVDVSRDPASLDEWRLIRRPMPGHSFFMGIHELLPGTILHGDGSTETFWEAQPAASAMDQRELEDSLARIVAAHEMGDVGKVALLSGGLDSGLIAALARTEQCYSVGLPDNNEFEAAADSADFLGKSLRTVAVSTDDMRAAWHHLAALREEPLSVPNEALIYLVCSAMTKDEKIVLTGEGADELFFGYDRIFSWALGVKSLDIPAFLAMYGYADIAPTPRLTHYIEDMVRDRSPIEFVEDWFLKVHLPGLLRRMDSASMAASKEARVPFADRRIAAMMYRQAAALRIDASGSKLPLRLLGQRLGLSGALRRRKIGFSATPGADIDRKEEYRLFQESVLGALQW